MINKLLAKLPGNQWGQRWSIWGSMVLRNPDGSLYLRRRRIFQTPWLGLYVHNIDSADEESVPKHDHPWTLSKNVSFLSFVLSGGYQEVLATPQIVNLTHADGSEEKHWMAVDIRGAWRRAGRLHAFPAGDVHKIIHVLPNTRTLVLVGRRKSSWNFFVPGTGLAAGLIPWKTYLEWIGRDPLGERKAP